jgi:hypothetical protein
VDIGQEPVVKINKKILETTVSVLLPVVGLNQAEVEPASITVSSIKSNLTLLLMQKVSVTRAAGTGETVINVIANTAVTEARIVTEAADAVTAAVQAKVVMTASVGAIAIVIVRLNL